MTAESSDSLGPRASLSFIDLFFTPVVVRVRRGVVVDIEDIAGMLHSDSFSSLFCLLTLVLAWIRTLRLRLSEIGSMLRVCIMKIVDIAMAFGTEWNRALKQLKMEGCMRFRYERTLAE